MTHWIHRVGNGLMADIGDAVDGTEWNINISTSDEGPLEINHKDGSEISFVNADFAGTLAIEYEPGDETEAAVKLNRGDYHHQSFGQSEGDAATEWVVNIIKQHERKNN